MDKSPCILFAVDLRLSAVSQRLFRLDADPAGYLAARWLFLRSLGLIFFSVFYSLAFQIRGLIGPRGILPARGYLEEVALTFGRLRFWFAPTLLWWWSSDRALMAICVAGMLAAVLLTLNVWPRGMLVICLVSFLSFVSAAQDFSGYQSDGMLLEAGFISLFFAPPGWRPRWGASDPPSRASRFLLVWLWFRIYFESGVAKILGHDPEWRNFTAMDDYYQNGPLPTWIAWYAQHLPHWFHVGTAFLTMALELVLIFAVFLPRPFRLALFCLVTPWQIGIILTSNYAFLNYLVLALGFLLVDDVFVERWLPRSLRDFMRFHSPPNVPAAAPAMTPAPTPGWRARLGISVQGVLLTWVFYATLAPLMAMVAPQAPLPYQPVIALDPFRIANHFGLFAVMTRGRYEIEFQGSRDGVNWTAYPFVTNRRMCTRPRAFTRPTSLALTGISGSLPLKTGEALRS